MPDNTTTTAPETHNDEQDPVGTQAQDVADAARREESRSTSPLESTKPESNDYGPAPASEGDLIDEMRRMEGEGRIDMSAFAGEPNHDDEPDTFGGETTDDGADDRFTANGEGLVETGIDDPYEDDDIEDRDSLLLDTAGEEEE